jgi:GH25 family lysozyme M1 (1,4-beta-N-acetylmuramidase)
MNEMVRDRRAERQARRTRLRIEHFEKRFAAYGEAHLYLAFHAAFPLILTPDLVYRIWINFDRDETECLLEVPWIATADLLLSDLCQEVGYELYEMNPDVRQELLKRFNQHPRFAGRENHGMTPRLDDLAKFLEEYSEHLRTDRADQNATALADVHLWTALGHSDPDRAVKEMLAALNRGLSAANSAEVLRVTDLATELAGWQESYKPLLVYLRGVEEFALGNNELAAEQLAEVDLSHFDTLDIELVIPDTREPEVEQVTEIKPPVEDGRAAALDRVLGIDVAPQYASELDYQKAAAAGVKFCFIRAGSGQMKDDEFYQTAYAKAGEAGLLRAVYFTIYPESDTNAGSMEAQAGYFASLLMDDAELGAVVDVEIDGLTPEDVKRFIDAYQELDPYVRPITIYTAAWFWNKERGFVGPAVKWAGEHPLWVAHHTADGELIEPGADFRVIIPEPWSDYAFHQWTAAGGSRAGQEQSNLNLNYFSGTAEELQEWAMRHEPLTPIGVKYVTAASGLNMRTGPGTEFPVLTQLALGTEVEIIEEGEWAFVRLADQTGYAVSQYLADEPAAAADSDVNPYVGPRAFTPDDRQLFFGRDHQIGRLLERVATQPVVVLQGPVGTGKSSLLHAGLVPRLEAEGYSVLNIGRIGGPSPEAYRAQNSFMFNLLITLEPASKLSDLAQQRLSEFLHSGQFVAGDYGSEAGRGRVLIIDHVEELFTSGEEQAADRQGFFDQLRQALDEDPDMRLVLVIDAAFGGELASYDKDLHGRLSFGEDLSLTALDDQAAYDAITRPAEAVQGQYESGVAGRLLEELLRSSEAEASESAPGRTVEPLQLQIVCERLWQRLDPGARGQRRRELDRFL